MNETKKRTTITDDFSWIIKVLQSSTNKFHIKTCDKLYITFLKKWSLTDDNVKSKYDGIYSKFKFVMKHRIRKNIGQ